MTHQILSSQDLNDAKASMSSLLSENLSQDMKDALCTIGLERMIWEANDLIFGMAPGGLLYGHAWINDVYDVFVGEGSPLNPLRRCTHFLCQSPCPKCTASSPNDVFKEVTQTEVHQALGPIFRSWHSSLEDLVNAYNPS